MSCPQSCRRRKAQPESRDASAALCSHCAARARNRPDTRNTALAGHGGHPCSSTSTSTEWPPASSPARRPVVLLELTMLEVPVRAVYSTKALLYDPQCFFKFQVGSQLPQTASEIPERDGSTRPRDSNGRDERPLPTGVRVGFGPRLALGAILKLDRSFHIGHGSWRLARPVPVRRTPRQEHRQGRLTSPPAGGGHGLWGLGVGVGSCVAGSYMGVLVGPRGPVPGPQHVSIRRQITSAVWK